MGAACFHSHLSCASSPASSNPGLVLSRKCKLWPASTFHFLVGQELVTRWGFQMKSFNGYPLNVVSSQKEEQYTEHFKVEHELESTVSITVVGASGDLAKKKIFPALFVLFYEDCIPQHFTIFGYARTQLTDEEMRNMISKTLACRIDKRF